MNFNTQQQLTVLASVTGLALAAVFFTMFFLGAQTPDWLPMMITGIGGYEIATFANQQWRRIAARRAGGR